MQSTEASVSAGLEGHPPRIDHDKELKRRLPMSAKLRRLLGDDRFEAVRFHALSMASLARRTLGANDRLLARYLASEPVPRLHIGCGKNVMPGCLNGDLLSISPNVYTFNATRRFPFPDNTFNYVFTEHLIEHLPYPAARVMMNEIGRVLAPGGRLRVVTPSWAFLQSLINDYGRNAVVDRYVAWGTQAFAPYAPAPHPVFVVNHYMRAWGHSFIFDAKTLGDLMRGAGLVDVKECALNQSETPELSQLENEERMEPGFLRLESMILEARKP